VVPLLRYVDSVLRDPEAGGDGNRSGRVQWPVWLQGFYELGLERDVGIAARNDFVPALFFGYYLLPEAMGYLGPQNGDIQVSLKLSQEGRNYIVESRGRIMSKKVLHVAVKTGAGNEEVVLGQHGDRIQGR